MMKMIIANKMNENINTMKVLIQWFAIKMRFVYTLYICRA